MYESYVQDTEPKPERLCGTPPGSLGQLRSYGLDQAPDGHPQKIGQSKIDPRALKTR
jgi:hypothetical protein